MADKLSFIKEEGFEPSPPEVQTLENEIRENKHSLQKKLLGQSRKKGRYRLSFSSGPVSLDGCWKEAQQGSGEKTVFLARMFGSK